MIIRKLASLDRFEGKHAVLVLDDNQEITVMKDELSKSSTNGDRFSIQIIPLHESELSAADFSRTILNQLLENETSPHS
jgi:hypothetical protein